MILDTKVLKLVEYNYDLFIKNFKSNIEKNIKIIETDTESTFNKETAIRELELFFGREGQFSRSLFGSATKFWIDFSMAPMDDILSISADKIKLIAPTKSFVIETRFKEEFFDELDKMIYDCLIKINSPFVKNYKLSQIKGKGYYGNLIKGN